MMGSKPRIMLLPTPRVIIIDDEVAHLKELAKGLNFYGVACLPILFDDEPEHIPQCPHVRVIFADLHLIPGMSTSKPAVLFSVLGSLLEDNIKPMGPYCIILWTKYPEIASELKHNLRTLKDIQQPFAIEVLDKNILLSKNNLNNRKLIDEIERIVTGIPSFDALFNWESNVLEAATGTMTSLLAMSDIPEKDRNTELGQLLAVLGTAVANETDFKEDPLRAINEALLPILADHITSVRSQDEDQQVWEKAIKEADSNPSLPDETLARLNKLFHIESEKVGKWSERGAVIPLPKKFEDEFKQTFGLTEKTVAEKEFRCKDFVENGKETHWILVQSQAACDYAQTKEGLLPFYLGLLVQKAKAKKDKLPAALWSSPLFEWENQKVFLRVHARFPISFPKTEMEIGEPIFRLREQILNSMIYQLHSHSARPGIMSL